MFSYEGTPWLWLIRPDDAQTERWHTTLQQCGHPDASTVWVYPRKIYPLDIQNIPPLRGLLPKPSSQWGGLGLEYYWFFLASPNVALYAHQALCYWLTHANRLSTPSPVPESLLWRVACIGESTSRRWQSLYLQTHQLHALCHPEPWVPPSRKDDSPESIAQGGWIRLWAKNHLSTLTHPQAQVRLWLPRGDLARDETLQALIQCSDTHHLPSPEVTTLYRSEPYTMDALTVRHAHAWYESLKHHPWRVVWLTSPESAKAWLAWQETLYKTYPEWVVYFKQTYTYYLCMGHSTRVCLQSLLSQCEMYQDTSFWQVLCPEHSGHQLSETYHWLRGFLASQVKVKNCL
jgi:hypothetical protein